VSPCGPPSGLRMLPPGGRPVPLHAAAEGPERAEVAQDAEARSAGFSARADVVRACSVARRMARAITCDSRAAPHAAPSLLAGGDACSRQGAGCAAGRTVVGA
jgi:hypothetical protein